MLLSRRKIIRTVSILFVGLLLFSTNANNKIPITKDQEYLKINSSLQVFSTPDTLNAIEAYHQIQMAQMSAMLEKENPGMQENAAYWLLFELTNQTESPLKYLEVRNLPASPQLHCGF